MFTKQNLKTAAICLLLAIGTALLYSPVLHFNFLNYDDQVYVVTNPHVNHGFQWGQLAWCFQAGGAGNWRPLTWISHMLDCQIYGLNAGGHHATNVLLHIFNALILFLVLKSMTGAFWRSAVVAALFAWHPLHIESVAWIAERRDVLSTFFWMLALWSYVCYVHRSPTTNPSADQPTATGCGRSKVFYCLSVLFFALGLMAKPMFVTLPFVLLLVDWWPLDRLKPVAAATPESAAPGKRWIVLLVEKIPFFALALVSFVLTIFAHHSEGMMSELAGTPLRPRIVNALASVERYVEKTAWPTDLGAIYPYIGGWPSWKIVVALLGLAAVTGVAIRWRLVRPYWLVGWLWFMGMLVPVSGVFDQGAQSMADRYTYVPIVGLFVIVVWDAYDLLGRWRSGQWALGTTSALVLGACFWASGNQLKYWKDSDTLFSHIARSGINARGHAEYAAALMNRNQLEPAQVECERAVRIAPTAPLFHALLGRILLLEGKVNLATQELRTALQIEPGMIDVHLPLGQALLAQGSAGAAAEEFKLLLKSEPGNADAHFRLGQALMMTRKFDEASAQFTEVLRLAPEFPEAHFSLALLLSGKHKTADAITQYQAALHSRPDYVEALNNLAWIFATAEPQYRNGVQAVQLAQRACQLTRNELPAMIGTLAAAYAEAGRFDDALAAAQKAHDVALARGDKQLAAENLKLMETYRAHRKLNPTNP